MHLTTGSHAIITGGSSGIGFATAQALAARGLKVSLVARRSDVLDEAATRLRAEGAEVATAVCDVADREVLHVAIAQLVAQQGPCAVLITSAGFAHPGYFERLEHGRFRDQMEVNYFGTLHAIEAVTPSMIEQGRGAIVGISSVLGLMGVYGFSAYAPTKFAVRGLLECLRAELSVYGIGVHCVFVADVDTPHLEFENRFKPVEAGALSKTIEIQPPEKVAGAIIAGISKGRFAIIPDLQTRVMARSLSLIEVPLNRWFDRKVRKLRAAD